MPHGTEFTDQFRGGASQLLYGVARTHMIYLEYGALGNALQTRQGGPPDRGGSGRSLTS